MPKRMMAALAAAALVTAAASAQPHQERAAFLAATGEGYAHIPPEYAEFGAEVTTRAETLEAATREHKDRTARAGAVLRGLERQGVTMGRSSFRLEQGRPKNPPAAAPKKGPPVEYRATTVYALKAARLDSLHEALSAIAAAKLLDVRTIRYGINDEAKAIDDARRAAVQDARRQAEVVAEAANIQLGEILEIVDGTAQSLGNEGSIRLSVPNVQVAEPATISFRAAINIKWRIKPRP